MERILINLDSRVKLKKSWCATNRKLRKDFVWNNKKWKILKIPKNYLCTDPTTVGSSRLTTSLSVSHRFLFHQKPESDRTKCRWCSPLRPQVSQWKWKKNIFPAAEKSQKSSIGPQNIYFLHLVLFQLRFVKLKKCVRIFWVMLSGRKQLHPQICDFSAAGNMF